MLICYASNVILMSISISFNILSWLCLMMFSFLFRGDALQLLLNINPITELPITPMAAAHINLTIF